MINWGKEPLEKFIKVRKKTKKENGMPSKKSAWIETKNMKRN